MSYPAEPVHEEQVKALGWSKAPPVVEELKAKARAEGLWNLFLPDSERGFGLSNLEYAPLCELMGRSPIAPEAFNCSAPDTGNMEVLGALRQPGAEGRVAGAAAGGRDPLGLRHDRAGGGVVGRHEHPHPHRARRQRLCRPRAQMFISGAGDPRCKLLIVMGKTDPQAERHRQQSMILVPIDAPGVRVARPMHVFGNDHAPHGHMEIVFDRVKVPASNLLLGEGRGFEIGPGAAGSGADPPLHAPGRPCRALPGDHVPPGGEPRCLRPPAQPARHHPRRYRRQPHRDRHGAAAGAARRLDDGHGGQQAGAQRHQRHQGGRGPICASASPIAPSRPMARWASARTRFLAHAWMYARTVRFADGPDEVHRGVISKLELAKRRGE